MWQMTPAQEKYSTRTSLLLLEVRSTLVWLSACLYTHFCIGIPDRPNRPYPKKIRSKSIEVGWEAPSCTGGHIIIEYNILYQDQTLSSSEQILQSVEHINPSQSSYIIKNLRPSTAYAFQMRTVTSDFRTSFMSSISTIITLPPGICICG